MRPPYSVKADLHLERVVAPFAASLTELAFRDMPVSRACFEAIGICLNLRKLTVACTSATATACSAACNALPNLVRLKLKDGGSGGDWFVKMLSSCTGLLECDAQGCHYMDAKWFLLVLQACPWLNVFFTPLWNYTRGRDHVEGPNLNVDLTTLNIFGRHYQFSSAEMMALLNGCPDDVTSLSLQEASSVSSVHTDLICKRFGHQLLSFELLNETISPMKRQKKEEAAVRTRELIALISKFALLRNLNVRGGGGGVGDDFLHAIVDHCPHVQHLSLAGFGAITDEGVEHLTSRMPQLLSISLHCDTHLTSDCVEMIARNCPLIENVLLAGSLMKSSTLRREILHSFPDFPHLVSLAVDENHEDYLREHLPSYGLEGGICLRKITFEKYKVRCVK